MTSQSFPDLPPLCVEFLIFLDGRDKRQARPDQLPEHLRSADIVALCVHHELLRASRTIVSSLFGGEVRSDTGTTYVLTRQGEAYLAQLRLAPPSSETRTGGTRPVTPPAIRGESLALALLFAHPDWTNQQIADATGCARTTLSRWPRFKSARAALRPEPGEVPHGQKDGTSGKVEASWDDDER